MNKTELITFVHDENRNICFLTAHGKYDYCVKHTCIDSVVSYLATTTIKGVKYTNIFDVDVSSCKLKRYYRNLPWVRHLGCDVDRQQHSGGVFAVGYVYDFKVNQLFEVKVGDPVYNEFCGMLYN